MLVEFFKTPSEGKTDNVDSNPESIAAIINDDIQELVDGAVLDVGHKRIRATGRTSLYGKSRSDREFSSILGRSGFPSHLQSPPTGTDRRPVLESEA